MKTPQITLFFALFGLSFLAHAIKLDTDDKKFSYAIGYAMTQNLQVQNVQPNKEAFIAAIRDALEKKEPQLSVEEMQTAINNYKEQLAMKHQAMAKSNKEKGEKFIAEYKKQSGVKTLESGVLYKVKEAGKGASPKLSDTVVVHYRGKLIDGTEFDSSYKRGQPATFPLGGVIQGWQIALQNMKPGGKWEVVIPSDLAYGVQGSPGSIGPNETLIFDIELLEVKK